MVTATASVFVFLALVTGSVAVFAPGRFGRRPFDERIRSLRPADGDTNPRPAAAALRRTHSSIPVLRGVLSNSSWADKVSLELRQANVQLRVGEYLLGRVLVAMLVFVVPVLITRVHPFGVVLGLFAGAAAYLLPAFYIRMLRRRRVTKIEAQLVEFLPMLASSLRSGFALQQGMELAAQQLGPPLADELALLLHDTNLGATMEAALLDLGERVGSTDLDMMITAILVQRTSGGNLAEVLDKAAETLRERARIRGDLQTLTASQRMTGWILSVYPILIGVVLLAIMPSMWNDMFTETLGRVLLGVALGLQVLGFVAIRRVMDIEI